jgi:DNA-binding transcriptional regulator LsrR (DeoR family)
MAVMAVQSNNRDDLLARVASLYYEYDMSQQEIADRLRISRSNISRLLKEAKDKGIVEIHIQRRVTTHPLLEAQFCARFALKRAMIVDGEGYTYEELLSAAGQLAAWYLEEILQPRIVMGISWGTGVAAAIHAFAPQRHLHIDIVQLIGSVGAVSSFIDGPELARQLASKLGGSYYYLQAPLFVDSHTTRDMFLEQPVIAEALRRAREAHVALVGIGTTDTAASSFLRAGHLTESQLEDLRAQGAVGETAGKHFDIHGNVHLDINNRVVAIPPHDLKLIPDVVAVACGLAKTSAILGVLRGGYINALATDAATARAVLQLVERA